MTKSGQRRLAASRASASATSPPPASTVTTGASPAIAAARSNSSAVSLPHSALSERTKWVWCGSSGTRSPVAAPPSGSATLPAGATPSRTGSALSRSARVAPHQRHHADSGASVDHRGPRQLGRGGDRGAEQDYLGAGKRLALEVISATAYDDDGTACCRFEAESPEQRLGTGEARATTSGAPPRPS